MYALDNPTFVQTNRLNLQPAGVQSFRSALQQAMQSPIQSEQDATNVLTWTMQASQQQLGLSPLPVALEFVYGAVESLDKYSAFVPPERNPGASLQLESNMVGIGVQIEMRDDGAEVMKVISGSPAQAAGLQKGDLILAVGGHQLSGVTIDQTVSLIAGPAGSPVVLGLQRRSQGPFTMTVTRQSITLHSVNDIQLLNGSKVGYFKLDKFTASANDEIENALQQLYRQGMQSLVVDLRGNPGGLLTAAIQISDKFLPDGTIVATRGRTASDNTEEHATRDHTWKVPLVVLVDHNSASASEIFAAAIQENRRGVVVGRTSYGKGTVQTQFPLQTAGCSLRITTARFYSPTGRVMAGSGVTPDVPVAEDVSGNDSGTYGVLDHDVQAALSVAQQGGFSNPNQAPNGNPGNMNPGQNQNLSSARGFSQPQMTQPFAQPQVPAGY
jgi:carboxyl-terminal processing protease